MADDTEGDKQSFFLLQKIDPTTGSWMQQAKFEVHNHLALRGLLSVDVPKRGSGREIDGRDYTRLVRHYSLPLDEQAEIAELSQLWSDRDFDPNTHTGRELALMLAGRKPLATFVEVVPDDSELGIIPEDKFAPHVQAGRMSRFEYTTTPKGLGNRKMRRVLYALPGEEWRFRAHQMIWQLADEYGWSDSFEKIEGFLLGYPVIKDENF